MGKDEVGTLARLKSLHKNLIQPTISDNNGRIVKLMGDGLLAEFSSVVDAVQCAANIQQSMVKRETELDNNQRIRLRIGVNLGDIIVEGSDIYGDGVNIAARLEGLAEPGGICVSAKVYEEVKNKLSVSFKDMGAQEVKNIQEPIRAYSWTINGSSTSSVRPKTGLPISDKPSIAVLPFDNMSGDPEQEYFVDGLVEDIITELSRFPVLSVISRQSSFSFKGEKVGIEDVSNKLGVHYVVEGSVRRAGNRVRVTAQLIEAEGGDHVWAERYDRELDDIFEVQDEVTQAIVAIVAAQLGKTVSDKAARKHPESIKAYEYYLQGNQHYARFNPDDNLIAMKRYKQAIKLDPEFAPSYAGLANTYATDCLLGWKRLKNGIALALESAEEALNRDGSNALARLSLGWSYINQGRWNDAELEFNRMLSLNSGDADILAELGMAQNALNNFDIGIPLLEKAVRLNPLAPEHYQRWLGIGYYETKRYRDAVKTLRAGRFDGWTYAWLAASYARLGEIEQSSEALKAFVEVRRRELQKAGIPTDQTADLLGNYKTNFRYESDWEHFIQGLHMAGLPD